MRGGRQTLASTRSMHDRTAHDHGDAPRARRKQTLAEFVQDGLRGTGHGACEERKDLLGLRLGQAPAEHGVPGDLSRAILRVLGLRLGGRDDDGRRDQEVGNRELMKQRSGGVGRSTS